MINTFRREHHTLWNVSFKIHHWEYLFQWLDYPCRLFPSICRNSPGISSIGSDIPLTHKYLKHSLRFTEKTTVSILCACPWGEAELICEH